MTDRPIEHRKLVQRRFEDVSRIVEAEAESMLSAATAIASQRAVELVQSAEETLPGFDQTEPVTIFLIDPEHDSEYQTWIEFQWHADPRKRLLANARARLELRPHPTHDTATALILRADYAPSPGSRHNPRSLLAGRRIVTGALASLLEAIVDYLESHEPKLASDSKRHHSQGPSAALSTSSNDQTREGDAANKLTADNLDPAVGPRRSTTQPMTMRRFSKILFSAVDTRTEPPNALDDVVALADRNDASLTVLGVVTDPPASQRGLRLRGANDRITDLLAAELTARLDASIEPFAGNRISTQVVVGNPPLEIVQHTITHNHDLLVVATDGNDNSAATIRRLLRLCPTPAWVLRPGHDGGRVLAAIDPDDDPDLNVAILQLAQSQASLRDGELHIAHAWELHGETILASSEYMPVSAPRLARLAEETGSAHRRAFRDTIADACINDHHQHFVNGTPIQAIVGLINLYRIDLLVMGSLGRAEFEGVTVGNTAEELFTKVQCSVLVLKPPGFRSPIQT